MPKASEFTDQREIISTSEEGEGKGGDMRWMASMRAQRFLDAPASLDFKLSIISNGKFENCHYF